MKVIILYFTKTGHTLEAAEAVAEGIRSAGSEVDIVNVKEFTNDKLKEYDALIVGSPCWAGSIIKSAGISGPVKKAITSFEAGSLKGKRCGGIAVHAGAGGENTIRNMGEILKEKGCEDYKEGPAAAAGSPLSLWKGPPLEQEDQERYRKFGAEFVT
jgi:flavodoxin